MIRPATDKDLTPILAVYETARGYMKATGNPTQWGDAYPPREMLEEDIRRERLYVDEAEGGIHGVFVLLLGADPAYTRIEDGGWPSDEPYGAIHRVAADGLAKGVFARCLVFCKGRVRAFGLRNLRIDTHEDNRAMRHLIEKHGFARCGVVYMDDGSPRIAYQYVEPYLL